MRLAEDHRGYSGTLTELAAATGSFLLVMAAVPLVKSLGWFYWIPELTLAAAGGATVGFISARCSSRTVWLPAALLGAVGWATGAAILIHLDSRTPAWEPDWYPGAALVLAGGAVAGLISGAGQRRLSTVVRWALLHALVWCGVTFVWFAYIERLLPRIFWL